MDPSLLIPVVVVAVLVLGGVGFALSRKKAEPAAPSSPPPSEPKGANSAPSPESHRSSPASVPPASAKPASVPPASPAPKSESPLVEVSGPLPPFEESEDDKTGPVPMILVTAVGRTDPGLKRKHNEDAYLVLEEHSLYVVADGMGRHAAGEVASRLAVDTVADVYRVGEFGGFKFDPRHPKAANRLLAAFHTANETVFKQSREVEAYAGMGTTMVALHFTTSRKLASIVHAGDSRCYRVRGNEIRQLTQDHTLGAAGIVGPSAYILSRAVGIEENLEPDVTLDKPEPGDIYVICSDGLSRMIANETILKVCVEYNNLDEACRNLIDLANKSGGRDNVTVILVRVDAPGAV